MNITFLGTGSSLGVPQPTCRCNVCLSTDRRDKRLRSSVLISNGDTNIVIDAGPDFRYQVLKYGIRHIDALLITHAHWDHIAGLDDVRGFNYSSNKAIDLYSSISTQKEIKDMFYYIFAKAKSATMPNIDTYTIDKDSVFFINGIKINALEVNHAKMKVLGFRINNLAYITDINSIDTDEIAKLQNLDILILNALGQHKHPSQFNLQEAINCSKLINPKRTFFTHIGHQMGLHAEVENTIGVNRFLAYDGLELIFD